MSQETKELAQFNEVQGELTALVAPTLTIKVSDFKSSAEAVAAAKQVKDLAKRVEAKRKELVEPLNRRVKAINEYAKQIAGPLDDAETHLKAQLVAFEKEQELIREAEMRKAEEERRRLEVELAAKHEAERQATEARLAEEAKAAAFFGGEQTEDQAEAERVHREMEEKQLADQARLQNEASEREFNIRQHGVKNMAKVWKCELIDINLVPVHFLKRELNTTVVLAAARGGQHTIPGIKLWQETTARIGANTYVPRQALGAQE